jgi:two-component system cell cycle sensor histidine kinase/response regulator CckA
VTTTSSSGGPSTSPAPASTPSAGRILLVDDDFTVATIITRQLSLAGFHVAPHTASETAIGAFADDPQAFDLAILDRFIPSISGGRLAFLLWQLKPDLPIVFISGAIDELKLTRQPGPHVRLAKPFRDIELLGAVRTLLGLPADAPRA